MTNMSIWDKLSVTDPKQTKDFTRAGGFKGTAIKPMYAIQKMTEAFGACGTGWGYTKPEYQIVDGTDGQKLVYCTVGLWHGEHPSASELVYGVGGDFIIVKQSSGLRSDDEAFKKAFTDALMNAMKHIGMSADVHMGQFDGDKYTKTKTEPKKECMASERVEFIIDLINKSTEYEKATKLQKDAKEECMKLEDAVSYEKISKVATEKRKQLKEKTNVVS